MVVSNMEVDNLWVPGLNVCSIHENELSIQKSCGKVTLITFQFLRSFHLYQINPLCGHFTILTTYSK